MESLPCKPMYFGLELVLLPASLVLRASISAKVHTLMALAGKVQPDPHGGAFRFLTHISERPLKSSRNRSPGAQLANDTEEANRTNLPEEDLALSQT